MRVTRRFNVRTSVWVSSATAAGLSIVVGVSIAAALPPSIPPVESLAWSASAHGVAPVPARTPLAGRVAESTPDGLVLVHQLVPLQHVQRTQGQVVIKPLAADFDAKGQNLVAMSELGSFDVPEAALRAYKNAAATMARTDPACQIPWTLLAGIGRVESDHGRYGGAVLGSDGISRPAILGVPLNGKGVAAIPDTDNGRYDGDKVWDRAVGPMQFIPSTWASAGRDGDGDGVADPNDIDDAALAAADYLCPASGSILGGTAMRNAILSYNNSDYYVALVEAFEKGYRTGTFSIPSPPPPPGGGRHHHRHHHRAGSKAGSAGTPSQTPSSSPAPAKSPSQTPSSSPAPAKSPSQTPSSSTTASASPSQTPSSSPTASASPSQTPSSSPAPTYLDETDELTGLAGQTVTVNVQSGTTPALVVLFQGQTW